MRDAQRAPVLGEVRRSGPRVPVNEIASIAHLPDARVSEPVGARRKFDNASAAAGNVYCAIMHYLPEGVARGFETRTAVALVSSSILLEFLLSSSGGSDLFRTDSSKFIWQLMSLSRIDCGD